MTKLKGLCLLSLTLAAMLLWQNAATAQDDLSNNASTVNVTVDVKHCDLFIFPQQPNHININNPGNTYVQLQPTLKLYPGNEYLMSALGITNLKQQMVLSGTKGAPIKLTFDGIKSDGKGFTVCPKWVVSIADENTVYQGAVRDFCSSPGTSGEFHITMLKNGTGTPRCKTLNIHMIVTKLIIADASTPGVFGEHYVDFNISADYE